MAIKPFITVQQFEDAVSPLLLLLLISLSSALLTVLMDEMRCRFRDTIQFLSEAMSFVWLLIFLSFRGRQKQWF
jgi:hypothetical protein